MLSELKIPFPVIISTALLLLSACATDLGLGMGQAQGQKIPKDRFEWWQANAPTCQAPDGYIFPSKEKTDMNCNDGDMNLFAGLLCASGDPGGCETVKRAQNSTGRWFRSPNREQTNNLGNKDSFSPDMALGSQLYVASANDKESLELWLQWLDDERPCWISEGDKCLEKSPTLRFCTDDTANGCTLRPLDAEILGMTSKHFNITPLKVAFEHLPEHVGINMPDMIAIDSAVNAPGYSLHLVAVEILLLKKLGYSDAKLKAASIILSQRQRDNPFFLYLAQGRATQRVVDLTLSLCPSPVTGLPAGRNQWAWEREDKEEAWKQGMLWDCIFMARLIGVSQ